jgi:phage terminase large subunit-like protein
MVNGWPPRWLTKVDTKLTDGDDAAEFIETYCRVTKDSIGGQAGELIKLRPWQRELINSIFVVDKEGNYKHRTAIVGLPRKSGKSALGSAIALYGLLLGPAGGEIYSCAGDRDQARIVFETAKRMVQLDPELSEHIKIFRDSMEVPSTGSRYRVLSADASSAEGLSPTLTIFDELHVQPNSRLWDTMTLGSGARKNAMTLAITTAGVKGDRLGNDTICYQLYQHGQRVVNKEIKDPSFFFSWHEPKKLDADWKDPKTWKEANPGFGDLSLAEDFESVIARTSEVEFRTKRLNQWVTAKESAFEQGIFERLGDNKRIVEPGESITLGFDGSYSGDSTALVGCTLEDKHLFVIQLWEKPLDDPNWRVPVGDVEETIIQACTKYDVREVVCDPYRWQRSMSVLDDEGLEVVSWPTASIARMGPAWQKFYDAVIDGELTHSAEPALLRHFANIVLKRDARGVRPTKETNTSPRKIDAAIAAIIAYDRATQANTELNPLELLY